MHARTHITYSGTDLCAHFERETINQSSESDKSTKMGLEINVDWCRCLKQSHWKLGSNTFHHLILTQIERKAILPILCISMYMRSPCFNNTSTISFSDHTICDRGLYYVTDPEVWMIQISSHLSSCCFLCIHSFYMWQKALLLYYGYLKL